MVDFSRGRKGIAASFSLQGQIGFGLGVVEVDELSLLQLQPGGSCLHADVHHT